jgi:hypothetical protein
MNLTKLRRTVGLLVLLFMPSVPSGKLLGTVVAPASAAEQTAQLHDLAERLLSPPYMDESGQKPTVHLLPGKLPTPLPFELPVPSDSRIVGSAVHSLGDKIVTVNVVLDVPGDAGVVLAFYQKELPARGWQTIPLGPGEAHGFLSGPTTHVLSFCHSAAGPWLSLTIAPRPAKLNDVRLDLQTSSEFCDNSRRAEPLAAQTSDADRELHPPSLGEVSGSPEQGGNSALGQLNADPIPPLWVPTEVKLLSHGMGGGGDNERRTLSYESIAETEQGVNALEAHFAQQLQGAGWTRLAGQAEGPLVWSIWKVPSGEDAQGCLFVREGPKANQRTFHIEVSTPSALSTFSGYESSSKQGRGCAAQPTSQ